MLEVWKIMVSTPMGKEPAVVRIHEAEGGSLSGTAEGRYETVELRDVKRDGNKLSWSQTITKPMKLDMNFLVTIDGDTLSGTSKGRRMPALKVSGERHD